MLLLRLFFISSLFILLNYQDLFSQNSKISLNVQGLGAKPVTIDYVPERPQQIFSGKTNEQGVLTATVQLPEDGFYRVNINNGDIVFFFVAGKGEEIEFKSSNDAFFQNMSVSGSDLNQQYMRTKFVNDSIKQVLSVLAKQVRQLSNQGGKEREMQSLAGRYTNLELLRHELLKNYLEDNYDQLTALFFTEELDIKDELELYDKIENALTNRYPDNFFVKHLSRNIALVRATEIGAVAPDIALPNPEGDTILLSSLRGNIVLLNFWAAWCGPCRRENPRFVRIYNRYKDQGFEIYGVSLDRDTNTWLRGIKDDKLTYTLVSDLKHWQSPVARQYGVTGIPYAILLDREGRIVAKGVRAHELEALLQDMLNKEKNRKKQQEE